MESEQIAITLDRLDNGFKSMHNTIEDMGKNVLRMGSDFKEVKDVLVGNDAFGQPGLIKEMKQIKQANETNKRAIEQLIDDNKEIDQKRKNANFKVATATAAAGLTAGALGKTWIVKVLSFLTQFWK